VLLGVSTALLIEPHCAQYGSRINRRHAPQLNSADAKCEAAGLAKPRYQASAKLPEES
jgi:hypothetical protein